MALDVSKFATVARAEKSIHLYNHTDAYSVVAASDYFANGSIISALTVGDTIIAVCSDGVFIFNVVTVTKTVGSYAATVALSKSDLAIKVANQAASTASDVAGLVTDFNTLLAALKTAGVMTAD